jgi:thymidylate kinase
MKNSVNVITFSGVDGAGKTTILREFTEILKSKYNRDIVELRHRPSILPILSSIKHGKKKAEEKTIEVLPRTGNNKSKLSSYIRFFYYLSDYIIGQWVIYFKYTKNNKLVIYDRYYFDFIVDSKRANIVINSRFSKFFYHFVFKSDMNIFLYAPPEVILKRKKELDEDTILSLNANYKSLFSDLNKGSNDQYVAIKNIEKDVTLEHIENIYTSKST